MAQHTRRDFLKSAAVAGGAAALAPIPVFAQDATPPADKPVQMTIARWKGEPVAEADIPKMARKLTEQAIENLGGIKRFVKTGDVVWVKPNIAWNRAPEFAANTNPEVVATIVRLCLDAGAKKVKVGDYTCNQKEQSYPASGIEAAAKAAGAEVVYLDDSRFKDYPINGKRLTNWPLYPDIIESNLVINVPIVKHHAIAKATICMKGYMGVIGGKRNQWHQDIATCLCDITAYMKPQLSVVDAIRILTANGPVGGNLDDVKRMDTIAAGTDVVALDAFGVELLGHKPEDITSVAAGHAAGLGTMNYKSLNLKELAVS